MMETLCCSHGPVRRLSVSLLVASRPAIGRWLQETERPE